MAEIYFTTNAVAEMLGVTRKTVCNWYDSDQLSGPRLPKSIRDRCGHRRITRRSLVAFMQKCQYPLSVLEEWEKANAGPGAGE